jgi:hypothetical protein
MCCNLSMPGPYNGYSVAATTSCTSRNAFKTTWLHLCRECSEFGHATTSVHILAVGDGILDDVHLLVLQNDTGHLGQVPGVKVKSIRSGS